MAPKGKGKDVAPEPPTTVLEQLFPPWSDAAVNSDKGVTSGMREGTLWQA